MFTSSKMEELAARLVAERGITPSTASGYIRILYALNGKQAFKNINFLKKTADIDAIMAPYAESTKKTMLAAIVSCLSTQPKGFGAASKHYLGGMNEAIKSASEAPKHVKSTKQTENWIAWKDVMEKQTALEAVIAPLYKKKTLTETEFNQLQHAVILGLYTYSEPRRNKDFLDMRIVASAPPDVTDANWLDLKANQFVFNVYKTAKHHGVQKFPIPADFQPLLKAYIRFHPVWNGPARKAIQKQATGCPFLVHYDGTEFTAQNAITRILNKILGRNAGSSILRHSFLTSKYGDELLDMKATADKMGHSVSQQREYVLTEDAPDA